LSEFDVRVLMPEAPLNDQSGNSADRNPYKRQGYPTHQPTHPQATGRWSYHS